MLVSYSRNDITDINISVNDLYIRELERIKNARKEDILTGNTSVGPHRDDLCVTVNGIDIRKYGSQGQQRTAALSLKLSEIDIFKDITGEAPILLLDDVFSELDAQVLLKGGIDYDNYFKRNKRFYYFFII